MTGKPLAELSDTPTVRKVAILGNDFIGMKTYFISKRG